MKRLATFIACAGVGIAIGYGRHAYLTGYIKGRKDLFDELERIDRRYARRTKSA